MFARLGFSFIGLICVSLTCAGQPGTIRSITVTRLADRAVSPTRDPNANLVNVEAEVSADIMAPVVLRISRVNGTGAQTFNMTRVNGRFRADSLAVPQGKLQYAVEATFLAGSTRQTTRRVIEQHSPVPDNCYFFDSPTPGWSGSGYLVWRGQNEFRTCGARTALVTQNERNFGPGRFSSSLKMSLDFALNERGETTAGCFLNQPENADFTSADFVSPDLGRIKSWTNATGFDVKAAAEAEAIMQLLIGIRHERTQLLSWVSEVDASGRRIFHDLPGRDEAFGMSKPDSVAGRIEQIRIRIFVGTSLFGLENPGVFIDRICPRH